MLLQRFVSVTLWSGLAHLGSVCSLDFSPKRNVPRSQLPNGLLSSRSSGSARRNRNRIGMRWSGKQRWYVNGREKRNVRHVMGARLVVSSALHVVSHAIDCLVQKTTRRDMVIRKRTVVMEDGTGEVRAISRTTVVRRRLPNRLGVALRTSRLAHAQIV